MAKLSLDDVFKKFDNIYEAVEVMALRARQVTDEHKLKNDAELAADENPEADVDEFGTIEIDRNAFQKDFTVDAKPTVEAIDQVINDEIGFKYISSEEAIEEKAAKKPKK